MRMFLAILAGLVGGLLLWFWVWWLGHLVWG